MTSEIVQASTPFILMALAALLALWRLESSPPLWWDEGWTMSVARNWVERGHYGRLLNGEPTDAALSAAISVTAPIALSFKWFGVGIWQARIVGVCFMLLALGLMYQLASQLYRRSIANAVLLCLIVLFPHAEILPSYLSRQVLGEMPMLCYLLAGFVMWLAAMRRSAWLIVGAILCWGLAINAKAQTLPFLAVAWLLTAAIALYARQWRLAALLIVGATGAYGFAQILQATLPLILPGYIRSNADWQELYQVTALVMDRDVRLLALRRVALYGAPTVLGFGYAAWRWRFLWRTPTQIDWRILGQLSLWALSMSWLVWFVGFSVGWMRYLFPAVFIGSLFSASLLGEWTSGFHWAATWQNVSMVLRCRWRSAQGASALGAMILLLWMMLLAGWAFRGFYRSDSQQSVMEVAQYINTLTPSDALIETYDSELFAFLDRRYHYPPDTLHIELIRAKNLNQPLPTNYDPRQANVDYVVVGPFSRWVRLYEPVLASGAFQLKHIVGYYEIYERIGQPIRQK